MILGRPEPLIGQEGQSCGLHLISWNVAVDVRWASIILLAYGRAQRIQPLRKMDGWELECWRQYVDCGPLFSLLGISQWTVSLAPPGAKRSHICLC